VIPTRQKVKTSTLRCAGDEVRMGDTRYTYRT